MSEVFIVAEVSKNWKDGRPFNGSPLLLSQLFENVINVNNARGYRLHSFQINRIATSPDELNETIIAVFEADVDQ
jgi:hypothetical protein